MLLCSLAIAGDALATPPTDTAQQPASARQPFFNARQHRAEYVGPGRELPPPADFKEVLIGYFGPSDPADPLHGDMWRAAKLALEEANAASGYQGTPFRLVPAWSDNPWGTGVAQLARMVYQDRVWAIIGGIDGPSTHLAEQVVAKACLTLVSPASSDKTVNLANVPWMFSCLPGDHLQAPVLAAAIQRRGAGKPFLIVSTDDHDARLFVAELDRSLAQRRMAPRYRFECRAAKRDGVKGGGAERLRGEGVTGCGGEGVTRCGGEGVRELGWGTGDSAFSIQHSALSTQHSALTTKIVETKVDAVVLVAGPLRSAELVKALRDRGFGGLVFGGPAMGRQTFLQEAGTAAEGVVFPLLYQPGEQSREFVHVFESRFGRLPDYAAAHTYDAVRLLVAAVRKAGLNRARIRDAVRQLAPWEGTTGTINWDALGANTRGVRPGTIRCGRVVSAADAAGCPGEGEPR